MKKFLSAFLAILMVLSMVATSLTTVFAADAEEGEGASGSTEIVKTLKEIILPNNAAEAFYDITKPGWAVGGGGQEFGTGWFETEIDGKTGVATTMTGSGNVVTSRFHYYAAEPTDISGMTHFELDLYISDASVVNGKQFIIEIQDKGLWGAGAESEIRYINNNAQFKNGWNHIKLSLNDDFKDRLGEGCPVLDRTVWQHCRVWFPDAAYTDADITYALGGLKFTNADYDAQSVKVPLTLTSKPAGWNWAADLNIKNSGSSAISTTLAANKQYGGGAGAFLACYEPKNVTYDASAAKALRFYLYTDDAAVMKTVQVEFELTSSGTCDSQENAYVGSLDKFVEGGIKNGWNEVIIPLTDFGHVNGGGANWSAINFIRMYNQQGFNTADVAMTIALDDFAFCNEAGEVVTAISGCDIETDWEGPTSPMKLDGETVIGNTWEAGTTLGGGWFMFRYGLNFEGKYPEAADISGMKYIEFDFYVSDANALMNVDFSFELTAEGIQDKNESAYNWKGWETGLVDGWNHIQWPLSWFSAKTNGTCDFTAWNFLRMFNASNLVVGENGLTVAMKNVEFTTGKYALELDEKDQPLTEKETVVVDVKREDKANQDSLDYVVKNSAGDNGEKFYADGNGEVIYRIPVSGKKYVKYVTLNVKTGAQVLLQASTDGENWTTVYEYKDARMEAAPSGNAASMKSDYYTFDLTDAVVGEKGLTGDYIYVRIADSYPQGGWGGGLYYGAMTFEIIRTIAPHEIKLPAYGTTLEGWNWSSSLNHAEGSFSASNTFAAGQTLGNANILVLFQSKDGEGVDASAADAFEFDLYVSNAAALKDMNVEMELTSGGRPDDHEKRYVNATLSALIEGGMKDGWNHVVLPLSKMGDHDPNQPIDWTNVNCFRQYFFAGVNTGDADLVVAYDNLIFTKAGEKVATLSNAEPNTNGWEGPAMDMNGQLVIGKSITGNTFGICDIYVNYVTDKGIDLTGMKYLEYDLYISDVEALKNVTLFTEINSSGDYDYNELGFDRTIGDYGLKNGWNRIKIEISKMTNTAGADRGECDLTDIKWFRIFTVAETALTDGLTYALANVRFTDDEAPALDTPANPEAPAKEIIIPSIDHLVPGWEVTPEKWNPAFDLKTPDKSNAYLLRKWDANATLGVNHFNMFWIVETADGCVSFDVSSADTFAIDMWISDVSMVTGKQFQIELANGGFGGIDANEATYNGTLDALVEGGLQNGWDTLKLNLASMGKTGNGADWTKIDWFRMYNAENIATGADGLSAAIDNVRFLSGDSVVAVMSDCQPTMNGWEKNARPIVLDGKEVMGQTWTSNIGAGGYFTFRNQSLKLDISGMKYVEFDIYVSDISALANVQLMFELRSGSSSEVNEWGINAFKAPEQGWVTGWNHVKWDLSEMSNTASGEFDATDVVWFRIANHEEIPVNGSLTIAMDHLRFTTDEADSCNNCHVPHEIYMPKPGTTVAGWDWEANLLLNQTVSISKTYEANTLVKFCDIYVEYKPTTPVDASEADALTFDFYVSDVTGIENATLEIEIASVSCDTEELNATGKVGALIEGGLKAGWNTVVMPFDKLIVSGGAIDLSNIKWFRIYNHQGAGEFTTGENGLTIALDNLRFTKAGKNVATLSDVNPDMKGWERNGTPIYIGDVLAQGAIFTENIGGGAGFNFLYIPGADVTLNVAGMKYFEFDWYVSNAAAIAGTTFVFELSSSGLPDNQEIGKIFKGADLGLKDGWNRIRFTIADLADTANNGKFNAEKFNFLRLFNDNAITVDGELTMAFTNIRFADDEAPELEMPVAPEAPEQPDDPDQPVDPEEPATKEDMYEFQIDNGAKEAPYLDPDYTANWNGTLRFADASQYFQYKYNLTAFRGIQSITFAGNFGGQYHIWASADGKNWVEIAKRSETSPAQSLKLDLTVLAEAIAETMTVYVRIGDSDTSNGNGGNMNGNVQLKVIYDAKADQTPIVPDVIVEQEKISFKIETNDEKAYLIENTAKWNNVHRYADKDAYYTYKYTVKNVNKVQSVIWKAKTCQEFKLDISFDNKNWTTVSSDESNTAPQVREYDLTEFLVKDGTIENATFYLKICDADTSDGWGGGIYGDAPVTLLVDYIPMTDAEKDALEATVTEHSIPLWGANKTWGDIYETDNENQLAGSGCVSVNLKGVTGTHAPSKKFDDINATGMDTFEFNVYLSDLAIVDHLKNNINSGSVELCSGGACDQAEKAVGLAQIFTDFVVGELTVGWNQIAIPLNRMAGTDGTSGPFKIEKINYIRIFWSGMTNPVSEDMIMKFDNFRMTDRQAAIDAAHAAFVAATLEKYAGLIKNIDALKPVAEGGIANDEEFKSVKAKYSSAKEAFDKATAEEQEVLADQKTTLSRTKAKIDAYQEVLDILEAQKDLIAALQALDAYKEASAFTYENYDEAKAAIEAARAAFNALTRKEREALTDKGYDAYLTAAENAMPATKPEAPKTECTEHVDADNNGKCDNCDADVEVKDPDTDKPGEDKPGTDTPGTEEPKKEGCSSALTIGAIATMILAGAWVTIAARKKED